MMECSIIGVSPKLCASKLFTFDWKEPFGLKDPIPSSIRTVPLSRDNCHCCTFLRIHCSATSMVHPISLITSETRLFSILEMDGLKAIYFPFGKAVPVTLSQREICALRYQDPQPGR